MRLMRPLRYSIGQRHHSVTAYKYAVEEEYEPSTSHGNTNRRRVRPRLNELRERLRIEPIDQRISLNNKLPSSTAMVHDPLSNLSLSPLPPPPPRRITHSPETYQDWQKILSTLPDPPSSDHILRDSYGRQHTYLRLSLTERCNFRCTYCMPAEGVPLQPRNDLLTTPEILTLANHFSQVGINKFRLTGGEPTLRKDIVAIVEGLKQQSPKSSVGITTNGLLLAQKPNLLQNLVEAGLDSINLSLDSMNTSRFEQLTRRPASNLPKVLQVLDMANSLSIPVKVNVVVMRHQNHDELADFIRLGHEKNVIIRFIEYMPFTKNGWNTDTFMSYQEMMDQTPATWEKLADVDPHDTTKWFQASTFDSSASTIVGFITSMSHHFCAGCNRLRISADGQIKVCLFDSGNHMISLRNAIRAGLSQEDLYKLVYLAVQSKPFALGGHADAEDIHEDSLNNRPMTLIGG